MSGNSNEYDTLDVVTKERHDEDYRNLVTTEELLEIGIKPNHDIWQTVFLLAKRVKALEMENAMIWQHFRDGDVGK